MSCGLGSISQTQQSIATFQKVVASEQATAKAPPPADVSAEQGELAPTLALIDQLNGQIGARVPELVAQWKQLDAYSEASTMIDLGAAASGASGKAMTAQGQALQTLLTSRDHLDHQITSAQQAAETAHEVDSAIQTADTKAQAAQADAQVAQLTAQRATVDAQAKATLQKIFTELDTQKSYAQVLASKNEDFLRQMSGKPLPPGAATLNDMLTRLQDASYKATRLRATIADKLAEPAKAQLGAKAHAAADEKTVSSDQNGAAANAKPPGAA